MYTEGFNKNRGILNQVRHLIVSIPDLCQLSYFDYTKYALLASIQYVTLNILMHTFSMSATYLPYNKEILKAPGGVNFSKYALYAIIQYVVWSKFGQIKNAVNLFQK